MLSKSKFVRGTNCIKSLWLYDHKKEERVIDESTQALFALGTDTGALAREYFPSGQMAVTEDFPGFESARRTNELIKKGVTIIYEATFIYDSTLVAVDILVKEKKGWHLYEMKSTNSIKPEHIKDVAVQYYVARGCGIEISDVSVMHMNRDYVRHGALDIQQLFVHESVLADVLDMQDYVKTNIAELLKVEKLKNEPETEMGIQCTRPYLCDFYDYCSRLLPPEPVQVLSNEPEIDTKAIHDFLREIKYPLYFLDFETIMPCVPMFDESRPYQQIPFQYSLHCLTSPKSPLQHFDFLASNEGDPRPELIRSLIQNITKPGVIFVYNIAFERSRLNELMRDFPEFEPQLKNIAECLVDIMPVFRKRYYTTESMNGSYSIKAVLPALCPELSYDEMEIREGGAASAAFMSLYNETDPETIEKTRTALRKYCELDTYGLVKIMEVLMNVK